MTSFSFGVFLVLSAATLWGFGGVVAQYLFTYDKVDVIWFMTARLILAGLVFLGYLTLKHKDIFAILKNKKDLGELLAFTFLGLFGAQYGYYYTISLCNAATATVLQYTYPVMVVLWVSFKAKKAPNVREYIGIFAALIGVFLLSTNGNISTLVLPEAALLYGGFSAFAMAFYTIIPITILKKYGSTMVVGWANLFAGISMSFFKNPVIIEGDFNLFGIALFAYMIIGATLLSANAYLIGIKYVGEAKASLISCAEPLVSIVCVVAIFGVKFSIIDFIGMACIIFTVMLLASNKKT